MKTKVSERREAEIRKQDTLTVCRTNSYLNVIDTHLRSMATKNIVIFGH